MVAFYVKRIQNGLMKLEDVPSLWKQEVKLKLKEMEKASGAGEAGKGKGEC